MCCGVEQNAYHTLESLTFVLPSGTRIDTAAPSADDRLRELEPRLHAGLLALKSRWLLQRTTSPGHRAAGAGRGPGRTPERSGLDTVQICR
jgi:hypothetical protein